MAFAGAGSAGGNAEVWKVSGGNYESVIADGNFSVDSLYLVLNNKNGGSIHLWSGNVKLNTSAADSVAWMDGASALNAAVGGGKAMFTEVEGFETSIFLSCFKSGITYKTNATAGGHRLLQVKGKGGKRVKELSMSSSYFASLRDVFILDAEDKLYIQAGPRASLYDRVAASSIADDINVTQRGGKATVVYMFEDAMNEAFWSHFKDAGAGKSQILCIAHEEPVQASVPASWSKVLKVGGSGPFTFTEVAATKASLSSADVFVVLGGGGDIVRRLLFVWVGSAAPADKKAKVVSIAFAYCDSVGLPTSTPIEAFCENSEGTALKAQFRDWDEMFPLVPFSDALGLTSVKVPRKVLDSKAKVVNVDVDEGGKVRVWRVEGITRVTMNKAICGQFYSNNCYILLYAYTPPGMAEKYILVYWVGAQSTRDDRGSSAILTKYIGDSLEGKKIVIRVCEGKEPSFLRRLFRGSLMIHRTEAVPSEADAMPKKKSSLLANFSMKTKQEKGVNALEQLSKMLQNSKAKGTNAAQLFTYVGTSALTLYALQLPLAASSLNNKDNFVVFAGKYAYVRCAEKSLKDALVKLVETKMKEVDGKAECEVLVFDVGKEPEDFWSKLGGKDVSAANPSYFAKPTIKSPKLYHATARSGAFRVSEIENFKKTDLYDDEVFLLDTYALVICWVGAAVSTQEGDLAIDYGLRLHEALVQIDGRSADSVVVKVDSGEEFALFTDFFLDWDKVDAEVIEAISQQQEISEILQAQKVAYEEAQAPQEEAPATSKSDALDISPTQEMPALEPAPKAVAAKPALKPVPRPAAKSSGPSSVSKWGDFKQDFSFVDIYPKVDPTKRYDYAMLKKDYETLKSQNVELNPMKKEAYLDEQIFQELFACSKTDFEALPMWKRAQMKKKVGLF